MRSPQRRGDAETPQPVPGAPFHATGVESHTAMQPLLLTLPQVAQQLGLSPARVYQLVALEGLPTIKIGRSTRVAYGSLVEWVKEREQRTR